MKLYLNLPEKQTTHNRTAYAKVHQMRFLEQRHRISPHVFYNKNPNKSLKINSNFQMNILSRLTVSWKHKVHYLDLYHCQISVYRL